MQSMNTAAALAERDNSTAVIETLHCKSCDEDFTRTRKRGVKPSICPACKAQAETEKAEASPARPNKHAAVEALGRDFVVEVCNEYGVTPRIAIPFLLIGQEPPRRDTLWTFKQTKVINDFDPDLSSDDDFDPLTGNYVGEGTTTASVLGLDLYSIPSA
jgi:hypothetical protein